MRRTPDVTVIIPVAPGADPGAATRALRRALSRGAHAELITVEGRHPTRQRNLAVQRASGDVVWFLDHDAITEPGSGTALLRALRRPGVVAAGGPNLAAAPRTRFEARAGRVIASRAGSPAVTGRYAVSGTERDATERSLILCNLAVSRSALLAAGGFDPRLYPNEENELLNRLLAGGRRARHVPDAAVRKPRPATLSAFLRESFRYGRGRAEQMWVGFRTSDAGLLAAGVLAVPRILTSGLGILRLKAWAAGWLWGVLTGWAKRRVRLVAHPVAFKRYDLRPGGSPRLIESFEFHLGSCPKGGYAIA